MDLARLKRNYFKYADRRIYDKITYYDHRTGKRRIRYVLSNKIKLYNLYRGVYLKTIPDICSPKDIYPLVTIILDININWKLLKKIYLILIRLNLKLPYQIIFDILKYNLPIFSFKVLTQNKEQTEKFIKYKIVKNKWKKRLY